MNALGAAWPRCRRRRVRAQRHGLPVGPHFELRGTETILERPFDEVSLPSAPEGELRTCKAQVLEGRSPTSRRSPATPE